MKTLALATAISAGGLEFSDPRHHHLANIAFGGPDRKTLYITESLSGDILVAQMPVAGKKLFAHL